MKPASLVLAAVLAAAGLGTSGCVQFAAPQRSRATSVMRYLYPRNREHIDTPTIPVLHLPLRVGIAFVPSSSPGADVTAAQSVELLQRVAAQFNGLPYVKSIQVIPPGYLLPAGGFENLDQVREMFDVDVIALVAYDQTQLTNEGLLSLSYWTVVGAYVIHGERNDTETLMEAAVYDIPSRKLLFRAPGLSQVKASATLINNPEELHRDASQGFALATTNLIGNLQTELAAFNQRVKQSPEEFKVVREAGYTGAGAFSPGWAILLALGSAAALARNRARS